MHEEQSLSSIGRAAVLIFDFFQCRKSEPLAKRGFSAGRVPLSQNRSGVLIFDLFPHRKSRTRGNPRFFDRLRQEIKICRRKAP